MNLINLPRLRMMELQTLAENSIKFCQTIEEVKPAITNVEQALTTFKQGMLKDKSTGVNKITLDKKRDTTLSGFIHSSKAERLFPHADPTVKEAITKLLTIFRKYGSGIVRLPYNEETSAIDNLVTEIKRMEGFDLLPEAVKRWIPAIEADNLAFKEAAKEFVSSASKLSEIDAASKLAPYLVEALEGLYTLLFAHLKISNAENIKKAYAEITVMVDALK